MQGSLMYAKKVVVIVALLGCYSMVNAAEGPEERKIAAETAPAVVTPHPDVAIALARYSAEVAVLAAEDAIIAEFNYNIVPYIVNTLCKRDVQASRVFIIRLILSNDPIILGYLSTFFSGALQTIEQVQKILGRGKFLNWRKDEATIELSGVDIFESRY